VFFIRHAWRRFHTYSSYARGLEWLLGAYSYLDLVPKGRDEGKLAYSMAWVRHHDRYENKPAVIGCCSHGEPFVNAHRCCLVPSGGMERNQAGERIAEGGPLRPSFLRRSLDLITKIIPVAILAVLPKCPCVPGRLRGPWDRHRAFADRSNVPATVAYRRVRGVIDFFRS